MALTDQADSLNGSLPTAPISTSAIKELLAVRPELTTDGSRPTGDQLQTRLAAFWFPDEVVLYIGLAGARKSRPRHGEVAERVEEYYATPLGANGPHAGGWPLKTLACLSDLYVHFAYCDNVNVAEAACISAFAEGVSPATRYALPDRVCVMPFANLEFPKGNSKGHRIRGARAPKARRTQALGEGEVAEAVSAAEGPLRDSPVAQLHLSVPSPVGSPHRSQRVTASDIAAGQVRIPIGATKRTLPLDRQDITVILRGRELTCRWDPRTGADKERSGIIRVGKAAAADLLVADEVLAVSVEEFIVNLG